MHVPVGKTILGAYAFTFGRIISIVGTAWLPFAVLFVYCFAVLSLVAPQAPSFSLAAGVRPFVAAIALGCGFLLTNAMVTAGVVREALGLHPRPVYAYFSLGRPVWRMLVALVLAMLIVLAARFVMLAVARFAIFEAGATIPAPAAAWIAIAIWILALVALFYVLARLLFFLPAVVIAENRLGLGRSWMLANHNVLRIVAVGLGVQVPVPILFALLASLLATGSIDAALDYRTLSQSIPDYLQRIHPAGVAGVALQLVYSLLVFGLSNASAASAYRALVPIRSSGPDTSPDSETAIA